MNSILMVANNAAAQVDVPSTSGSITSVFFALVFVILAIVICAWLVKRLQSVGGVPGQHMKVLSVMPLSHRERVMLVDVAGQQLLLGVTPGSITTLHVFDEPVITKDISAGNADFSEKFKQFLTQSGIHSSKDAENKEANNENKSSH
ncbi:MAG: flagellar biosynthetic protein FliO [Cellvibrionaceae bacterium]